MKNLIILFLLCTIPVFTQIKGKIVNSETNLPLTNANVFIMYKNIGTQSGIQGEFSITGNIQEGDILKVSYIGFTTLKITLIKSDFTQQLLIYLTPAIIPAQSVLIEASVGEEGTTPLTFDKINKQTITDNYTIQDIPQFLSELPSTTFYSENGNGIGYNYLSIRGFDQRRITVSINGIPQNDPEDHEVYWLDFPDLLSSTDFIQVQRGAGSGIFGYPAVGGSINIITSAYNNKPECNLSSSIGSYNTRKYSVSLSSGLVDNKYSFSARVSQILSSGYRDLSWTNFGSYYLSAARFDDNLTTQINLYGGPIADGLAYTGLPKFAIGDKNLRRKNYSDWGASGDSFTYVVPRRPEEIENFSQPHYELLNELKLSDNIVLNSALFFVTGSGFFNYDGSWGDTTYFRLTRENGFNPSGNPGNTLIGAWVENKQGGWIPKLSWKHPNGEFITGAEFRIHRSEHWGNINYAENLPAGVTSSYQYYSYKGGKDMISGFVHESYQLDDKINLLGELQLAYSKYILYDEKYVGTDFFVKNTFLNPRLGINYKYIDKGNIYFSFARVSREPRLLNYYDAAESGGGSKPQFSQNQDGNYNFNDPLVHPETMNDFELGASYGIGNLLFTANLYLMVFDNEIVNNGQLDRFGEPVTGNVKSTIHRGIELSAIYKPGVFSIFGNMTISKNYIKQGNYFIDAANYIDQNDNEIGGFPEFLLNLGVSYNYENLYIKLNGKYSGAFYSDNYGNSLAIYLIKYPGFVSYTDNRNDPWFSADLFTSYSFTLFNGLNDSKIYLQINNLFDRLYSMGAIGAEFYPAAERNFIAGINLGL
jgi:iron complex outermembrane receptor protein